MKYLRAGIKLCLASVLILVAGCSSSGSVKDLSKGQVTLRNYLEQSPGVIITGEGPATSVRVRGNRDITGPTVARGTRKGTSTSVQTENSPLFVIDGEIVGRNFYRAAGMLTPNIITEVRVLSPNEAAHYGSRGMHGAVVITTKRVDNKYN